MTAKEKVTGLFVPHITPYDAQGKIDEKELRKIVNWLINKGVGGLYPNGSMGEFARLSYKEHLEVLKIVVDETAGRVPILAGAAEANMDRVLQMADEAKALGCRAISVTGPYYYNVSQESIECYFSKIAEQIDIDMLLYNIPAFANEVSLPVIENLARKHQNIVGVKDSSGDLTRLLQTIDHTKKIRDDFSVLVGWEGIFVPAMLMGADGGALSSAGVVPELFVKIMDELKAGNEAEAKAIQISILDLFKTMVEATNFPEGFREGYNIRGFNPGRSRMVMSPMEEETMQSIRLRIADLLGEFGYSMAKRISDNEHPFKHTELVL